MAGLQVPDQSARLLNQSRFARVAEAVSQHECPFGRRLPGEVTWPDPEKDLRTLVNPLGALQAVAVFWSYIPYAVAAYAIGLFLVIRGTRQLFVLAWLGLFVGFNEVLIKPFVSRPRPGTLLETRTYNGKLAGSCLETCGMPSSHAGLAAGLMVLIFLDSSSRVRFMRKPKPGRLNGKVSTTITQEAKECIRFTTRCWVLPWMQEDTYTHTDFVSHLLFWVSALSPVPVARIILFDHTVWQVIVGAVVGTVLAGIWWRFVRNLQRCYRSEVGKRFCHGLIKHNFPLQDQIDHPHQEEDCYSDSDTGTCPGGESSEGSSEVAA